MTDELIDRFGEPPKAVKGLIDVVLIRNMALQMGIYEITQGEEKLTFFTHNLDMNRIGALSAKFPGRVSVGAVEKSCIHLSIDKAEQTLVVLRDALLCMKEAQEKAEKEGFQEAAEEFKRQQAELVKKGRFVEKKLSPAMQKALEMQKQLTSQKRAER